MKHFGCVLLLGILILDVWSEAASRPNFVIMFMDDVSIKQSHTIQNNNIKTLQKNGSDDEKYV